MNKPRRTSRLQNKQFSIRRGQTPVHQSDARNQSGWSRETRKPCAWWRYDVSLSCEGHYSTHVLATWNQNFPNVFSVTKRGPSFGTSSKQAWNHPGELYCHMIHLWFRAVNSHWNCRSSSRSGNPLAAAELTSVLLTLMGSWKTVHTTTSLQLGVVREPM